jgi:hypothetical protein
MVSVLGRFNHFIIKVTHFEFWPFTVFYTPIVFKWLWDSLRAGSLTYFTASNPLMEHGGFIHYSKYNIIKQFPEHLVPKTIFFRAGEQVNHLASMLEENGLAFPLIAKPDKGERGKLVSKLKSFEELVQYLGEVREDVIIQEFIHLPLEFGVMYHKIPGETSGRVSSILERKFLVLSGDGRSTLEALILAHPRAKLYYRHLIKKHRKKLHKVYPVDHEILMEPIGNHRFGIIFQNANHLIDVGLTEHFNDISSHLDGFYFGRYDIKVGSVEDLYTGENLKIIELNGANSEPGHIYDPGNSLLNAYRDLNKHWNTLYEISIKNHAKGIQYQSKRTLLKLIFDNFRKGG